MNMHHVVSLGLDRPEVRGTQNQWHALCKALLNARFIWLAAGVSFGVAAIATISCWVVAL